MKKDYKGFSPVTPQRVKSAPCSPLKSTPLSLKKKKTITSLTDSFHSPCNKVPTGDSPYVKAKHVQIIEKDPSKAVPLFWSAINCGDRVDRAVKDMAVVMKQLNRADEAIEAIKSFRSLCSQQAQESLDNVLIDLYKKAGRINEHIELLQHKLQLVEDGVKYGGKRTKIARAQGKKYLCSIEQEKSSIKEIYESGEMEEDLITIRRDSVKIRIYSNAFDASFYQGSEYLDTSEDFTDYCLCLCFDHDGEEFIIGPGSKSDLKAEFEKVKSIVGEKTKIFWDNESAVVIF
ncbi:hypothetical protein MKX01_006974 [Papaver californicum]|nr:hypothetical protein MKX01_006974 [Papaver californicum]